MSRTTRIAAYAALATICLWLWHDRNETTASLAVQSGTAHKPQPSESGERSGNWLGPLNAASFGAQAADTVISSATSAGLPNVTPSLLAVPSQNWTQNLVAAITNVDPVIRRSGLEQAVILHTSLANDPSTESDSKPPMLLEIERRLIEAAWGETDPMLIEDEYLPFLAAQSAEAAQPILEHLLETPLPGETLSAIVETLVDSAMWSRAQAGDWIQKVPLSEDDQSELLSGLHEAFPDWAFDNPSPSEKHVG